MDVDSNRKIRKWSNREKLGRLLWAFVMPFFRLSPRPLWGWRRLLLKVFGARVGYGVHVDPTAQITIPWNLNLGDQCAVGHKAILYALGSINIGARTTVSQGVHLCGGTHDWRDPSMPLIKKSIHIGSDVWICADAFVGPGVKIGEAAIVGACAVVMKDVQANVIVAGNPAQKIGVREP
jgi:putative colanic acid biosynthesis acetyltransferase WcaF